MGESTRTGVGQDERAIIHDLYPSLRRFAAVVAPGEVDPDDLLQEALLRVLERGSFKSLDSPGAYVRRTMVNVASNQRRRMGRGRRGLQRVVVPESFMPDYPSDVAVLLRLAPRARAVLFLTKVEGQTYAEVAEVLDCTETAARAVGSRARRKLRSVLAEEASNESA